MANWDDEEEDTPKAAVILTSNKSRFADEDASDDDVKDDWDASDEEVEVKQATGPAPPVRAKGATRQKIAAKEAEEERKREEIEARRNDTPHERKARENAAIIQADLDNAADLLGSVRIGDDGDLFSMKCQNMDDFNRFSLALSTKIIAKHGNNPLYAKFMKSFFVALAAPLRDVDVRLAASDLTVLANRKTVEQKEAMPGGKKKKALAKPGLGASKTVGSGRADTGSYEEALDDSGDYDDFM